LRSAGAFCARIMGALRGPGLAGVLGRGAAGHALVSGAGALTLVGVYMLLARLAGPAEFGSFLFALTLLSVLALIGILGVDTALIRYVAAYRGTEEWSLLAGVLRFGDRVVLTASTAVALLGAAVVGGLSAWSFPGSGEGGGLGPSLARTLWVAAAALPLYGLLRLRSTALQGLKRVAAAAVPENIVRPFLLLALASGIYLALGTLTGVGAMGAYLVATAGAAGIGSLLLRRFLPPAAREAEPVVEGRPWMRTALPLSLVSGMRLLLNQTDILLVGFLAGTTAAGIYGAASRLSRLVSFGLMAGNSIAAPVISELHARGERGALQRAVTLAAWGTTVWALLAALVLAAGASFLLGLFGEEFRTGAPILIVLAAGQVINGATGPVGYLLNMTGHEGANARILAWITGLNLVLSAPAILAFGPFGAAVVTSVLTGAKNLWTWWVVRGRLAINSSIFSRWSLAV